MKKGMEWVSGRQWGTVFELGVLVIYLGINEICSNCVFISSVLLSQLHFTILMLNHRLFSKELHFLEVVFLLLLIFFVHVTEEDHLLLCQSDDDDDDDGDDIMMMVMIL